jgi:hypothetical protein
MTWTEREAAENNPAARKWKEFYRKLAIQGDSDADNLTAQENAAQPDYSDEEWADIAWKLNGLRHQYFVPRMLRSVLDQVFYVVESARYNLRAERVQPQWRTFVAVEMYEFYTALEEAVRSAREIEHSTGFSGEVLYAEADE